MGRDGLLEDYLFIYQTLMSEISQAGLVIDPALKQTIDDVYENGVRSDYFMFYIKMLSQEKEAQ